jgi:hypothetical protein
MAQRMTPRRSSLMPQVCVIAVAGPVNSDNTANVTNLVSPSGGLPPRRFRRCACQNWLLDGAQMAKALGVNRVCASSPASTCPLCWCADAQVVLINDFAAIGYGLLAMSDDHLASARGLGPAVTPAPPRRSS